MKRLILGLVFVLATSNAWALSDIVQHGYGHFENGISVGSKVGGTNEVIDKNGNVTLSGIGGTLTVNSLTAASGANLTLNTTSDDKQVRINSRSFTQATGDSMAFQAKPSQTVTTTGSVQGGQISPRLQTGVAAATLIGLHVDTDMKGTTGNVSTAIRTLELENVNDATSTRTVADYEALKFRINATGTTLTNDAVIMRVPATEGGYNWTLFGKFDAVTGVFVAPGNTSAISNAGYLKIKIGSTAYRIPVLEDE
jgi:hypothetical protein